MGKLLRKKAVLSGVLIVVLLLTAGYMAYGHYIGKMVKEVVLSALMSGEYVEGNPYSDMISDEDYNEMVILRPEDVTATELGEAVRFGSPFVVHWLAGAKVWVKYECDYQADASPVLVRFDLVQQDGKWRVVGLDREYPMDNALWPY